MSALGNPLGTFVPGNSVIHRAPAGPKFLVIMAFILAISGFISSWPVLGVAALIPVCALLIARIPVRSVWGQVWPILPIAVMIVLIQGFLVSWPPALLVGARIIIGVLAAVVATATTKILDLTHALEKVLLPLHRIGIPGAKIALAIALTIRLIPLQFQAAASVLEAHRARGATHHPVHTGTAITIRSLRRAEAVGDALTARGVDDD